MEIVLPQLGLFAWTAGLFLIFFFILKKKAWKPIVEGLREREDSIENSLKEAAAAREEMANLKSENEEILREARQERDKMLKEGNHMRELIIKEAHDKAKTTAEAEIQKAREQIASEKRAAIAEIKVTAGSIAVEVAEKLLRKEFDNRDAQVNLAEQLISDLNQN